MKEINFLIVASGKDCEKWVDGCIKSVEAQTYRNFNFVLADDGSRDNTPFIIKKSEWWRNALYITDSVGLVMARHRYLQQLIKFARPLFEFDVIVWLDLDDQLLPNALERLAKEYQDPDCWLTYGGYTDSYGNTYIGDQYLLHPYTSARQQDWKFIPLRSFRKELYFKLTNDDLFPAVSEVYPDANMLYCMLEMCGQQHVRPINEPLYLYNCSNPLNVTKRFPEAQRDAELAFIKSLTPKQPLHKL